MRTRLRQKIELTAIMLMIWESRTVVSAEVLTIRENLVKNARFEVLDSSGKSPVGWYATSARNDIAPQFEVDLSVVRSGKRSARPSAQGIPGTFGFWKTNIPGIEGGSAPSAARTQGCRPTTTKV